MRAFEWLGGVPRECVYDNLRSVVARREGDGVVWNQRFLHLRGHYGFHDSGGDIVNLSSVAARIARARFALYAATKWGMNGWSESLRL